MEAVHQIHTHLDLNSNEIRDVRLEHLESDPSVSSGRFYFNSKTKEIRYSDGVNWHTVNLAAWSIDDEGNIVAEGNVVIRGNLIVEGDTVSSGSGEDTPADSLDTETLRNIFQEKITESNKLNVNLISGLGKLATLDSLSKSDVDLGKVDNTADSEKYVLAATKLVSGIDKADLITFADEVISFHRESVFSGDVTIDGNLIVKGDTSSGGNGQDTSSDGQINTELLESILKGYLPLTGGTLFGGLNAASFVAESGYITAKQGWFQNSRANQGLYNVEGNARWYYNLADDAWKSDKPIYINNNSVIHSGNIANQSVLSASKLTSRHYLWGNSFDGTQDISGNILLQKGKYLIGGAGEEGIYITDNTISWHGSNNLYSKGLIGFDGSDKYLITIFSNLKVAKPIMGACVGGMWIAGKTDTNAAFHISSKMQYNSFSPVLSVKTLNDHTITYGGIEDKVGFYGYDANRTQNGSDWQHYFDVSTGDLYHSGHVTFYKSLSVSQTIFAPTLTSTGGLNITAHTEGVSARLYLTTGTFRPWTADSGNIDLGSTAVQWRSLYAKKAYLDGSTYIQGGSTNPYVCFTLNDQNWYCQAYTSNGVDGIFLGSTSSKSLKVNADGQVYCPKDLIVSGDTASGSDVRFKDIQEDADIKVEDIANAPYFAFKWNDRDDNDTHVGTSAQYWEKILPELVNGEDFKTLNYGSLGVAMGVSLAKQSINHEERIKMLEEEVKVLNAEINRLRNGQIC